MSQAACRQRNSARAVECQLDIDPAERGPEQR
jgi:hypothetical protein